MDNLWERCTWEFEFVVPKYLAEPDTDALESDVEDGGAGGEGSGNPTIVICSGELVEQVNVETTLYLQQFIVLK